MRNIFLIALMIMLSGTALAEEQERQRDFGSVSVNMNYTNDYVWRGVSQGDQNALQFGLEWDRDILAGNMVVGAWTSEVDFDGTEREANYYAGYTIPLWADHIDIGFGYVSRQFDNSTYNHDEAFASISFLDAGLSMMYAKTEAEFGDEFAKATWTIPYIDRWVDVNIIYNYFEKNETQLLYGLSKEFNNGMGLHLLTGEDYMTEENFTSVGLSYNYTF